MQSTVAQSIRLAFGGIESPANIETQNILITGAPGSGKTNAVRDLCRQFRSADQKMIRVVSASDLDAIEIRPTDIVFNPLDIRFPNWDMWAELQMEQDYKVFATAFLPYPPTGTYFPSTDATWKMREILCKMFRAVNNAADFHSLVNSPRSTLSKVIEQEAEEWFFSSVESEVLYSREKSYIQSRLMVFNWLKDKHSQSESKFSLRDWAADVDDRRCVYLTYRPDLQDVLLPFYSLALDIVARELLSQTPNNELPEDQQHRVWIVQDDWIINYPTMPQILGTGHRFGVCSVNSAFFLMLKENFGESFANEVVMTSNIWLVHRSSCAEEAGAISNLIGPKGVRDRGSHAVQMAVSPAEIQMLKDCSCFLHVNGRPPVMVNIPFAAQ